MRSRIIKKRARILAPMAQYTRYPFRALTAKYKADITITELINVRALYEYMYKKKENKILKELIYTNKDEPMTGIQLFGTDPELFGLVVRRVLDLSANFRFIDLNLGCPARTVTRVGAGVALLKKPEKVEQILEIMVKHSPLPISIKTRLGWDNFTIPKILKIAQEYNVEFVTIHLRYATEGFGTPAHKNLIEKIVRLSEVPIVANGDVFSWEDFEYYFNQGATGVAVGRWAKGNPLIFSNETATLVRKRELFKEFLFFYKKMLLETNVPVNISYIKKFAINLIKGSEHARKFKYYIQQCKKLAELEELFIGLKDSI